MTRETANSYNLQPGAAPSPRVSGLSPSEAIALVQRAEARLWSSEAAADLAYLRDRGLLDATIRAARLGVVPSLWVPTQDQDRNYEVRGISIPWFEGDRLCLVKIRQRAGRQPRYAEVFADRPTLYPGPQAIVPEQPVIICEGELDCLLLAQQLEVPVVTTGSASGNLDSAQDLLTVCPTWYAAHDADPAGERAAAALTRAVRVRPPAGVKDWTDLHRRAPNSIRYHWGELLGHSRPWEALQHQTW